MERLHLSVHCAEPGRKYNERKSAERFLCYHTDTEESLLYFSQRDQSLKNTSLASPALLARTEACFNARVKLDFA